MWKSPSQCGIVGMYAKKQHLVLTKAKVKNDKCNIKLRNPPTWRSCFSNINVEALMVKFTTPTIDILTKILLQ